MEGGYFYLDRGHEVFGIVFGHPVKDYGVHVNERRKDPWPPREHIPAVFVRVGISQIDIPRESARMWRCH